MPRARKLLHLAKQPHQSERSAALAVFPCVGPSLSPGNFLLFDPGPGFGQCSETATVSSPFKTKVLISFVVSSPTQSSSSKSQNLNPMITFTWKFPSMSVWWHVATLALGGAERRVGLASSLATQGVQDHPGPHKTLPQKNKKLMIMAYATSWGHRNHHAW